MGVLRYKAIVPQQPGSRSAVSSPRDRQPVYRQPVPPQPATARGSEPHPSPAGTPEQAGDAGRPGPGRHPGQPGADDRR